MTYNELRKTVKTIHGGLPMDIAIHQSTDNGKIFTDIIVSSKTEFVKYSYIDERLCFVHGVASIRMIEKMKKVLTPGGEE